jgi:AcrR family transcriptional regulator
VTIEAITDAAAVSKRTVYRWWPAKAAIVAEAFREGYLDLSIGPVPSTGDLEADLTSWLADVHRTFTDPRRQALMRAFAGVAATSEAEGRLLASQVSGPAIAMLADRIDAARASGDADPGTDPAVVAQMLIGALLYHLLTWSQPAPTIVSQLVTTALHGITSPPS